MSTLVGSHCVGLLVCVYTLGPGGKFLELIFVSLSSLSPASCRRSSPVLCHSDVICLKRKTTELSGIDNESD
jgi:hypothetical protein